MSALSGMLRDPSLDKAFKAEAMLLPSEEYLGNQMTKVDVAAIHQARENLRQEIAGELRDDLASSIIAITATVHTARTRMPRSKTQERCALYLMAIDEPSVRSLGVNPRKCRQHATPWLRSPVWWIWTVRREAALRDFYTRWQDDSLKPDKWLSLQAISPFQGRSRM